MDRYIERSIDIDRYLQHRGEPGAAQQVRPEGPAALAGVRAAEAEALQGGVVLELLGWHSSTHNQAETLIRTHATSLRIE